MNLLTYFGRNSTLAHQFETAFRTPPASPNTQLLKFSEASMGRVPELADDPTMNNDALMEKRDEQDSNAPVVLSCIPCLRDIGTYLKMLCGDAVVTGTGPYTHTFTLGLGDRPSSLFEIDVANPQGTHRFHRHLGVMLNSMGCNDILDANAKLDLNFIGAVEVRPYPVAAFDTTPTALRAKSRFCKKLAKVWDGASPIGDIAKFGWTLALDLEGQSLADGLEGFGGVLLGQPSLKGTADILFSPATLVDDALARASKHVVVVHKSSDGTQSLTIDIPQVEFDVPQIQVKTSKGLVVQGLGWHAHKGSSPVTFVLVNDVASY